METKLLAATRNQLEFALVKDRPLRLAAAKGRRVECVAGIIWITAYNEAADFELRPGDVFIVPNSGLTLVEAIDRGRVRVDRQRAVGVKLLEGIWPAGVARLWKGFGLLANLAALPKGMRTRN